VVNDLFVSVEYGRRGVGRELMETARRLAISSGACFLRLETAADNLRARRLYESLGYRQDDRFMHYTLPLQLTEPRAEHKEQIKHNATSAACDAEDAPTG
jgi:RimJ/RimL family protein N-acetyltransferase